GGGGGGLPPAALGAGGGFEKELAGPSPPPGEVEEPVKRAGLRVHGEVADPAQVPVVFDEAQDRGLVGHAVVHEVRVRPRRDGEQRLPRAIAAAILVSA